VRAIYSQPPNRAGIAIILFVFFVAGSTFSLFETVLIPLLQAKVSESTTIGYFMYGIVGAFTLLVYVLKEKSASIQS
jgi:hypothetical protein